MLKFWFTRVALQCTTIKLIVLLHFIFFFFFLMVQLSVLFLLTFLKDFSLKPFTQGLSHAISHHLQALATLYTEGADDGSQYRDGKINHFLDSLSLHLLSLSFF